uniref:Putative secreted protein ovary overexpressed n=1 Tax=Rhipicephalus microplus TaxID=6941 RepID=A0A6M2DCP5_RHIMP
MLCHFGGLFACPILLSMLRRAGCVLEVFRHPSSLTDIGHSVCSEFYAHAASARTPKMAILKLVLVDDVKCIPPIGGSVEVWDKENRLEECIP